MHRRDDALWNGEDGAGGISWVDRSRMGLLRGVIDAADESGRRNAYMHVVHTKALRKELARASPVRRALDFGCGTGRFLKVLSASCGELYAVDREPAMIEAARAHADGCAKRIECWDEPQTSFEASFFDFVLCSSVLCVTTSELFERSLAEIARVSVSGGTLLLLEQIAHARGLTLSRYCSSLSKAGFEILRAYPIRSGWSPFTRLVTAQPWIPVRSFDALADFELMTAARAYGPETYPYVEYAVAARRR